MYDKNEKATASEPLAQEQEFTHVNLNLNEIISRAWQLTKKHFPTFLILGVANYMLNGIISQSIMSSAHNSQLNMLKHLVTGNTDAYLEDAKNYTESINNGDIFHFGLSFFFAVIIVIVLSNLIQLIKNSILWKCVLDHEYDATEIIKTSLRCLPRYIFINFTYGISILFACLCCLLPGLFFSIRLLFVPIIAANNPEMNLSEVFSRSWNLTRGYWWQLFAYSIVCIFIFIAGYLCCCIGIIPAIIVCFFIFAETYRRLSRTEVLEQK